jgi:hypothetical protein
MMSFYCQVSCTCSGVATKIAHVDICNAKDSTCFASHIRPETHEEHLQESSCLLGNLLKCHGSDFRPAEWVPGQPSVSALLDFPMVIRYGPRCGLPLLGRANQRSTEWADSDLFLKYSELSLVAPLR